MKKIIQHLLVLLLFTSYNVATTAQVVLSGTEGNANHIIAQDMKRYCTSEIEVQTSSGSMDNFKNLNHGIIAFLQYDVLQQELYNDLKNITSNTDSIRVLMSLGNEEIHLIAHASSNIKSIRDLNDQSLKIAVGGQGQGTAITAGIIKEITGCSWTDVNKSFKESIQALLNKEIDAFFFVGSAPVSSLKVFSKLAPHAQKSIKLIPLEDKRLESSYDPALIKAGTYKWADYDVKTYSVKSLLVTKVTGETKEDKKKIEDLLRGIKTNVLKLQKQGHSQWSYVDFSFNGIQWDIHEVAKDVFFSTKKSSSSK